jgi:hypothetical protein
MRIAPIFEAHQPNPTPSRQPSRKDGNVPSFLAVIANLTERLLSFSDSDLEYQSEQVVGCVGARATSNSSADPCNLSCRANVCGEEIEV